MSAADPTAPQQRFLNCEMQFECPKNWFELTETEQAGVKHCSTCQKNVYLCVTQDELDNFAHKGECIAFFSDPDLPTRFKLSREKAEINRTDSVIRLERVTLGLPRSANRGKLKVLLEKFNDDVLKNLDHK
jgi:hypothetical protein